MCGLAMLKLSPSQVLPLLQAAASLTTFLSPCSADHFHDSTCSPLIQHALFILWTTSHCGKTILPNSVQNGDFNDGEQN